MEERGDVVLHVVDPAQNLDAPRGLRPDFALIASPTHTHVDLAQPLLEAGIPCLVEKPLARSV